MEIKFRFLYKVKRMGKGWQPQLIFYVNNTIADTVEFETVCNQYLAVYVVMAVASALTIYCQRIDERIDETRDLFKKIREYDDWSKCVE